MKILVVSNVSVPPIVAGSCKCISSYCNLLKQIGHDVHFLYSGVVNDKTLKESADFWENKYHFYNYGLSLRIANKIKRVATKIFMGSKYPIDYYYPAYGFSSFVNKLQKQENFDAVIVNYPWMTKLLNDIKIPLKLYFTHDMFTDKRKHINAEYYTLTSEQEKEVLERADIVLSIQETESQYFRSLVPDKKVLSVFTPFEFSETPFSADHNVLFFSGNSDLNRNGIIWFINEVWPKVCKLDTKARLVIGGGICKGLSDVKTDDTIELLGFIDNVKEFYSLGNIAINPVYQGTGLKIKTLEAVSYGKITIVHPHSVEGIYLQEAAPVIVANDANQYASIIAGHICNEPLYKENSVESKKYIEDMYEFIISQYQQIDNK